MKFKKIAAIILALALVFSFTTVNAFAGSYAKASVPVILTVSNEYRVVSVTVPASFPIEIVNGTVVTADNAKITNNAKYGSVKVSDVSVNDGTYRIGNYENFSGKKTVALKINGIPTKGEGSMSISSTSFPVIAPQESLNLRYFAKVSKDASTEKDAEIAKVVFTITVVN